jgi:hypothetical protein
MADPHDDHSEGASLNERILDLLVFVPAGLVVTVVEELPKLAERGRHRLGVRVSSARAVGTFAVKAGGGEFRRRSESLLQRAPHRSTSRGGPMGDRSTGPTGESPGSGPIRSSRPPPVPMRPGQGNGHIPAVSTLSIPGFDTLSASQVVQRLDGLNRIELVSVRAYEASTRGRRTILNRVDQLLDERS